MYVCKAGHRAIRKARTGAKVANQLDTYYFDINLCKQCPLKEGCYKEEAKSKTYSITIKSLEHSEQKVTNRLEILATIDKKMELLKELIIKDIDFEGRENELDIMKKMIAKLESKYE